MKTVNVERLTALFAELVEIDAISFQEREMADVLKQKLTRLGLEVWEDEAGKGQGGNAGNVYAFLPGNIPGAPILFSAHMDTVIPGKGKKAVIHPDGKVTSDGRTVLGADDVSGLAAILEALEVVVENQLPHPPIEILFPIAEEVYLKGSQVFDFGRIQAKEAYVLDLSGPVGTVALAAPTVMSFSVEIQGKAAHAGFSPEEGINAIAIAAEVIGKTPQGRIDEETTLNVALVRGGRALNIVSDEAAFSGEVRSLTHEKVLEKLREIEGTLQAVTARYGASYTFATGKGCQAYRTSPHHPVVKRLVGVARAQGVELQFTDTFGGSDNNTFMEHGITGIVMASGMNQVHSTLEYTTVSELEKCAGLVVGLMTGGKI